MPTRQKSCDACVRSKRRCDKAYPHCTRCRARSVPCVYQRLPPAAYLSGGHAAPPTTASLPSLSSSRHRFSGDALPHGRLVGTSGFNSSTSGTEAADFTDMTDMTDWSSASVQVSSAESSRRGSRAASPERPGASLQWQKQEPASEAPSPKTEDAATAANTADATEYDYMDSNWLDRICDELQNAQQPEQQDRDANTIQMDLDLGIHFPTSEHMDDQFQFDWSMFDECSMHEEVGNYSLLLPLTVEDVVWKEEDPAQWDAPLAAYEPDGGVSSLTEEHRETTPQPQLQPHQVQPQPQPQPQFQTQAQHQAQAQPPQPRFTTPPPIPCILHNPDHHISVLSSFLSRLPSSITASHTVSFIHPSLYPTPSATPSPIRACFATCVLYTSRTRANEDWIDSHVCAAVDTLLSTDPSSSPAPLRTVATVLAVPEKPRVRREKDRLASTQALLVYLAIAISDEETFKPAKVAVMADVLERWTADLCALRRGSGEGLESVPVVQSRARPKSWNVSCRPDISLFSLWNSN